MGIMAKAKRYKEQEARVDEVWPQREIENHCILSEEGYIVQSTVLEYYLWQILFVEYHHGSVRLPIIENSGWG